MSSRGEFFSEPLMEEIKGRFHHVDADADGQRRLFFDNAGGSFRLKAAVDSLSALDTVPDNPERIHGRALRLQEVMARGESDIQTILNARDGSIFTALTASETMFDMVRAIMENVPGGNAVTTILEHPSSFDSMKMYCERTERELRVAPSNPETGGVDVNDIVKLVDGDTVLLSVMYASNISGAKFDLADIVEKARAKNPDLYIVVDAVQHAPHGVIDLQKTPVDGINFAPYKFFGCRGSGIAWLSPRVAKFPHHRLLAKPQDAWQLGTPTPGQFAMVTKIVDYIAWLGARFNDSEDRRALFLEGMHRIELQERALLLALLEGQGAQRGLRHMPGVEVYWDHDDFTRRDLIVGIGFSNLEATEAVREYERRGVIVYERVETSVYSGRMLKSFGLKSAVRLSPLHCHSRADIERFLVITEELLTL
ncbi:selenocysteine lyase/cysteine desulfurase [Paraburkholderia sp. BL23I1N1]|uniref:aminotransferase class V-fold PLP-dependent enzyme n=1 Tax=Paraburkholderia sp. BL23I1N1 TaxID=1938802 RepID=UPI000E757D09|nr:aminotransferase class V-fold PLP-dependent enzyme [Paraburkholderia sp. BL23I1N1]RKE34721.1 selenocysteine lyase/cysteine desulfurase [Paraburkholderia sp. BL23I1N1]